ncbi:MAG: NAD-dependent deacylase, partial [Deltaproteobacteria bacterium]|nr:NAD-dependent deacylase [Deltaproteobacteria bacterium]
MSRSPDPDALALRPDSSVAVLTGAGISAESGIHTFRDAGGLWDQYDMEEVATEPGFLADPARAWKLYSELRAHASTCRPNAAHAALATLEARLEERGRFTLITQNVDGLHQKAGSRHVIPIHGSLFMSRCSAPECPTAGDP